MIPKFSDLNIVPSKLTKTIPRPNHYPCLRSGGRTCRLFAFLALGTILAKQGILAGPSTTQIENSTSNQKRNNFLFRAVSSVIRHETKSVSAVAAAAAKLSAATPEAQRAFYVRDILNYRLQYVKAGHRMKDFDRWVKMRKGDAGVFSMHGVHHLSDNNKVAVNIDYSYAEPQGHAREPNVLHHSDPFLMDRLNLNLVITPNSPQGCFKKTNENKRIFNSLREDIVYPPSTFQLVCRAIKLGIHFAPVWSTVLLAAGSRSFREKVWYKWVANAMGSSGAAWIKWGQWSSTRADMFPYALCDALGSLHNEAPQHSFEYSKICVEQSLGIAGEDNSLLTVFDEFDEKPLASGSVAQVHKAVLCGQLIAVKIRHPRVARLIDMDFRLMAAAARAVEWCFPKATKWLHISDSVSQFSHTMAAQAMLHVEAHHLEILNYNFRRCRNIKFPVPFYASSSVIMETFEPGKITPSIIDDYGRVADALLENSNNIQHGNVLVEEHFDADDETQDSTDTDTIITQDFIPIELARFIVTTGTFVYLKMLLVDNLMHADLHPGNMLVDFPRKLKSVDKKSSSRSMIPVGSELADNVDAPLNLSSKDELSICLVDAGMVAQLSDEESAAFIGLFIAMGKGDGKLAAKFALRFSLENKLDEKGKAAFAEDMEELFSRKCQGYGTNVDVGEVLRGVLGLIRKYQVRIDANFATLAVNALCLQALAAEVCPEYNVLDAGKAMLQTYEKMCYSKEWEHNDSARNSRFTKVMLATALLRKKLSEDTLFQNLGRKRRERLTRKFGTSITLDN